MKNLTYFSLVKSIIAILTFSAIVIAQNNGSISGVRFEDLNGNGVINDGEPGLPGATISLFNGIRTTTTTTGEKGNYSFINLGPGTYIVSGPQRINPDRYLQTTPTSYTIPLSGQNVTNINFGIFQLGRISGRKFEDLNGNGDITAGERGLQSWTIELFRDTTTVPLIATTLTDRTGKYRFTNLRPVGYIVREVQQEGWIQTTATPSSIQPTSGQDVNVNFGNFQIALISGAVFRDLNLNGKFDASENGWPSVEVNLIGSNPNNNQTVYAGNDGEFQFEAPPDEYTLSIPAGTGLTVPVSGSYEISATDNRSGLSFRSQNFGLTEPVDYIKKYRSFLPEDIVAVNAEGKIPKAVKRRPDNVEFELQLRYTITPTIGKTGLNLKLSKNILEGYPLIVERNGIPLDEEIDYNITYSSASEIDLTFTNGLILNDRINISGYVKSGRPINASYYWTPRLQPERWIKILSEDREWILNRPGLPMPTHANLISEVYRDGAFTEQGGLLVGTPRWDAPRSYGWVILKKYKDVQYTLRDGTGIHTGGPFFFSNLNDNRPFLKQWTLLPPRKQNNKLFAEIVALKLAIASSATGHTEPGFGDLIYEDTYNDSLNGKTVQKIAALADIAMTTRTGDSSNFYRVIRRINEAFAGPLDTTSFFSRTVLTGTRTLADVPYLLANPDAPITRITPLNHSYDDVPDVFELCQNYPNPFNPTTTIEFTLPEDALVTLKVYSVLGQEVATLSDKELYTEGLNYVELDASRFSSGVYFYHIAAETLGDEEEAGKTYLSVKRMLLLK